VDLEAYKVWAMLLYKIPKSIHPSYHFHILPEPDIVCHDFEGLLIQTNLKISCGQTFWFSCDPSKIKCIKKSNSFKNGMNFELASQLASFEVYDVHIEQKK
jgi:hypothetical protein